MGKRILEMNRRYAGYPADLYKGWLVVPQWEAAITIIPKNASRSINKALIEFFDPDGDDDPYPKLKYWRGVAAMKRHGYGMYTHSEMEKVRRLGFLTVGIVRDPIERFRSFWRCSVRDGRGGVRRSEVAKFKDPRVLIEAIWRRRFSNVHWMPQALFLDNADLIVPISELPGYWAENYPKAPPIQMTNTTEGDEPFLNEAAINKLRQLYARDIELWQKATES